MYFPLINYRSNLEITNCWWTRIFQPLSSRVQVNLLEGINGNKTLITKVIIYHYKPIYNLTKRHVKEGSSLGGGFDGDDDDDDDDDDDGDDDGGDDGKTLFRKIDLINKIQF